MTVDRASQILGKGLRNLKQRQGSITLEDVEGTVINTACFVVLKGRDAKGARILSEHGGKMNMADLLRELTTLDGNEKKVVAAFADAAQQLVPQYDETHSANALIAVGQNCAWEGMEDFLVSYFRDKHGKSISFGARHSQPEQDDSNGWIKFRSTSQSHFKSGQYSHDTSKDVIIKIRHVGNGYIEAVAPEHPEGLLAELSDFSFGSHAYVSDDLTRSFLVVTPNPNFKSASEISECRTLNNRTSDFVSYTK